MRRLLHNLAALGIGLAVVYSLLAAVAVAWTLAVQASGSLLLALGAAVAVGGLGVLSLIRYLERP